jgi:hypothetical protein
MKPTKNVIFCPDCQRRKMLFESEAKAMNFIKFNGEAIEELSGKAPIRAYFCEACAGWHLTSKEAKYESASPTEKVINRYNAQKEQLQKVKLFNRAVDSYRTIVPLARESQYAEAMDALLRSLVLIHPYLDTARKEDARCQLMLTESPAIAELLLAKETARTQTMKEEGACLPDLASTKHQLRRHVERLKGLNTITEDIYKQYIKQIKEL